MNAKPTASISACNCLGIREPVFSTGRALPLSGLSVHFPCGRMHPRHHRSGNKATAFTLAFNFLRLDISIRVSLWAYVEACFFGAVFVFCSLFTNASHVDMFGSFVRWAEGCFKGSSTPISHTCWYLPWYLRAVCTAWQGNGS